MTITFSPDLQKLVQQQMATGRYGSENDLLLAAVQLLSDRQRQLEELRRELQPALDSLDRGEGEPLDMDRVRRLVGQRRGSRPISSNRRADDSNSNG